MISIIDCGMGNIGSVANMVKHLGFKSKIVSNSDEILSAEKLIFPGVGHWDNGVNTLEESGLASSILDAVKINKTPILGICLGMQLLFESSEEGKKAGLSLIPGLIKKFEFSDKDSNLNLRVPHMGWNVVSILKKNVLLDGLMDNEARFYFVHSYHACNVPNEYQLLECHYGYNFTCGVNKENIWGFQFHPEKSHKFGMQLIKNFIKLT